MNVVNGVATFSNLVLNKPVHNLSEGAFGGSPLAGIASNSFAIDPLKVIGSPTVNPSGFTVTFNTVFELSAVNLNGPVIRSRRDSAGFHFFGQGGRHPGHAVPQRRQPHGDVRGQRWLLDLQQLQLRSQPVGDPADGGYTITFKSGAAAFKDVFGNGWLATARRRHGLHDCLLDHRDAVRHPDRVLPQFAQGPTQTVNVGPTASSAPDLHGPAAGDHGRGHGTSGSVTLTYDPNLLTISNTSSAWSEHVHRERQQRHRLATISFTKTGLRVAWSSELNAT